ncbi:MAG: L-aspartate oxidase [Planctomycetes bacterium]|nr:L-aspartate oxidase [Planctomycetota bacterium]
MLSETLPTDRYVLACNVRRLPAFRFDVVVVGSGVAGAAAALAAADRGAQVAVLAKSDLRETNTLWAQGGMAAVLEAPDSFAAHEADTLAVGCGLSEREVVECVVRGGPGAVERLLRLGAQFDRRADGQLVVSREGGHSHARIVHAHGDATGVEIQNALTRAIQEHPAIACFPSAFAVDVLTDDEGRAAGVLTRNARGDLFVHAAAQVVLATGGGGQIYRETTNPAIATGDGVAIGFRAGAVVRDLEFVQFHPTCLYIAGAARVLISEIVRGHGGILVDRNGVRFMPEYHPAAELAPRDVVSRAVSARMAATQDTSVYLDLSRVQGDPHALFPGISRICRFFGIDIARDPVPVRPGAHYMVGGLRTDLDGRTSVPGLLAVGECASSGLHGANRMGSNSLLEGVVLGERAGRLAAAEAREVDLRTIDGRLRGPSSRPPPGVQVNLQDLLYSLKSLMWRQVGVERTSARLQDALEKIRFWTRAVSELELEEPRAMELVNMLTVARLIALGGLAREESRGTHQRAETPETRAEWRAHTLIRPILEDGRIMRAELLREPVRDPAAVA